jgi:endonuclease/exonuclease/phosphatase (EEP) superfamily protein YafD
MDRFALSFLFTLTLFLNSARADAQLLGRYFRTVPLAEAHVQSGFASERELREDSIRALVWNIKKTQERPWLTEFLQFSQGQDLFLLQEFFENDLFLSTISMFSGFRWDFGKSFTYRRYGHRATGTMLGSNVEPAEIQVKHSPDREPVTGTPKAMTFGQYPVQGSQENLLVISVHAINFTTLATFRRQLQQAAAEIRQHRGPVLIAGDFNTRTKGRMNHMLELMISLGLKPVVFKNGEHCMTAVGTRHCLDHAFVRGLRVKRAEVIGSSRGSDHKPMLLELALARP